MATQTKYASSVVSATQFTNGANAYSLNDSYATWSSSSRNATAQLVLGIEAFTIPTGSTINSVTLYMQRKWGSGDSARIDYARLQIANGSTLQGTQWSESAFPTTDTDASTDGGTWTVTDLNSGNMRAYIDADRTNNNQTSTFSIDAVWVVVDYSAGSQSITTTGISSAEAVGTASVGRGSVNITPSGISSIEALGSLTVAQLSYILVSSISSVESFGTPVLSVGAILVTPSGVATSEAFGTTSITTGVVGVTATGIASAETVVAPVIGIGAVAVSPSGIGTTETFGTLAISTGAVAVVPDGISSLEGFGSPTLTVENIDVFEVQKKVGDGDFEFYQYVAVETFTLEDTGPFDTGTTYTYRVRKIVSGVPSEWSNEDSVTFVDISSGMYPSGISSAQAFGTPTVLRGTVTISLTGIESTESFGTFTITQYVLPSGVSSVEALGQPTVSAGAVEIVPSGVASLEAFGTSTVSVGAVSVLPVSIESTEAFGTVSIGRGTVSVSPTGIPSSENFGTASILTDAVTILPNGIAGVEEFGSISISTGAVIVSPSAIESVEAFGTPVVDSGLVQIIPDSIGSAEAFGTPIITTGIVYVEVSSIVSDEAFGNASISGMITIVTTGITSSEEFGIMEVTQVKTYLYNECLYNECLYGGAPATYTVRQIQVVGIISSEVFGSPNVGKQTILQSSIVSAEAFGALQLSYTSDLYPSSIISQEAVARPSFLKRFVLHGVVRTSADLSEVQIIETSLIPISRLGEADHLTANIGDSVELTQPRRYANRLRGIVSNKPTGGE